MQHLAATHSPASNAPRRRRVFGVLLSAAVGMGWFAVRAAAQQFAEQPKADTSWYSPVLVALAAMLGFLLQLLIYVVGYVTIVLTKIFIWAVTYSDFIYNGTVTVGWEIVRDFSNMFFVVAILAIAWATILQLESYGYRRLLPKLVLMAVLINFSKLITGVIIDLGQIVILTFAQASVGGLNVQGLFAKLGVGDLTSFRGGPIAESDLGGQAFSLLGTLLFGFILLVIIFGVILAYTVIFTFRIVALWILIILSPLAFLLAAFPAGQSYSRQWWSSLSKYVTTGAVIMFFFWLALVASERAFSIISPELVQQQGTTSLGVAGSRMGEPINLSRFIITISFLIAGLVAAQKAGVAGSDFAGSLVQRLRRAPGQLGRLAYRSSRDTYAWAARKVQAGKISIGIPGTRMQFDLGKYTKGLDLNVMNWARGFKESRAEKKIQEEAIGRIYSGEALHKGGWRGTFKGLGSGRDFFDAYAKGFLNVEGFKRMGGAMAGGENYTKELFKDVARELNVEKHLRAEADEKEALAKRENFYEEGVEQYVEDEINAGTRTAAVAARRTAPTAGGVSATEKRYRKEFLKSQGMDDSKDKEEIERLSGLGTADSEYLVHFGSEKWGEFTKEKDTDIARKELRAEAKFWVEGGTQAQRDLLQDKGKARVQREHTETLSTIEQMRRGELAGELFDKRQSEVNDMVKELKRISQEIGKLRPGETAPALRINEAKLRADLQKIAEEAPNGDWNAYADKEINREANRDQYNKFSAKAGETAADSIFGKLETKESRQKAVLEHGQLTLDLREQLRDEAKKLRDRAEASKAEQATLKKQAAAKEAPRAFYADEGYQRLVREQMGKITGENSDELNAAFRSAQRDGDKIKASAIAMKMAKDGNDNELWNEFGFTSDAQGKHDFFDAVMMGKKVSEDGRELKHDGPSFNMSEQEAFSLENAIDYINEDVNHWETARTMKMEGGLFKRMSEEEHSFAALAEIMKKNPREVARAFNRLAYGGERVTNRATGAREFFPSQLGKAILMSMGPEILTNINRGEFNKNAVVNIGKWVSNNNGPSALRRFGIDDRYIKKLDEIYESENRRGTAGAADTIRRLFHELM